MTDKVSTAPEDMDSSATKQPTSTGENTAGEREEILQMKLDWRSFLTEHEMNVLRDADNAKAVWLELNRERAAITNRAIHRAKYRQKHPAALPTSDQVG